jgi:hypothetical protein
MSEKKAPEIPAPLALPTEETGVKNMTGYLNRGRALRDASRQALSSLFAMTTKKWETVRFDALARRYSPMFRRNLSSAAELRRTRPMVPHAENGASAIDPSIEQLSSEKEREMKERVWDDYFDAIKKRN